MKMYSDHGQVLLIPGTKRIHMAGVYSEPCPGILCWLTIDRAWKQVPIFFVPVNISLHSAMFKFNIPFSIYAPKT